MSYETYKLGNSQKYMGRKKYSYEELMQFEVPRLREICKAEHIKPPTMETMESKQELAALLYRYLGTIRKQEIRDFNPESVKRLQVMIGSNKGQQGKEGIELPAQLLIYKSFDSLNEKENHCEVRMDSFQPGCYALLMDGGNQIQAILQVERTGKKQGYRLSLAKERMSPKLLTGSFRDYSLLFFSEALMEEVVLAYHGIDRKKGAISFLRAEVPEVLVVEMPETEDVLVIDYGTSYTTAGTYQNETGTNRRIGFASSAGCEFCAEKQTGSFSCERCELCPSVIAVKRCSRNQIEFLYGQDAIREEKERGYISKNSIFYDTKRWVNHYKEKIHVSDLEGNTCEVEGRLLVRAFLLHIIRTAEQQNKVRYQKICMTCPVKQKSLSIRMYQDVLPDYQVVTKDVIDEAVAVVYHSLADKVERLSYQSGETKQVLVLDCGGGTSDMVRCDYRIRNQGITSGIELEIRYAHGNTNFGGNNLTYRVLQYLKIRLAEHYAGEERTTVEALFPGVLDDLYEYVDTKGAEEAYRTLEQRCDWAETVIPTKFQRYHTETEQRYLKIKGNYYFLWHLAEHLKRRMYNHAGLVLVSLPDLFPKKRDAKEMEEAYCLTVKNKRGVLESHSMCPAILAAKEEISLLLKPDIYSLAKNFIGPYYENGELSEIDQIFLSGQTCKIELFRDVLKEFIAGRKARSGSENSCVKKFMCIDGAVSYQGAKKVGRIRPKLHYASPLVPYQLTVPDFYSREKERILIEEGTPMDAVYGFQSRPVEAEEILFTLKDQEGKVLHTQTYRMHAAEREETTYGYLRKEYPVLRQEDIDSIQDGEVKLFVFCEAESWGYLVFEAAREEGKVYYRKPQYVPFESSQWETDFFDGLH